MLDLLPDLCDQHGDALQVAEPLFHDYGGKPLFYGEAVTLSCFEDNSLGPRSTPNAADPDQDPQPFGGNDTNPEAGRKGGATTVCPQQPVGGADTGRPALAGRGNTFPDGA